MTPRNHAALLVAACGLLLVACGGEGPDFADTEIQVLSSDADQVTGGDARIAVEGVDDPEDVELWLNGQAIGLAELEPQSPRLEGTVEGLGRGENTLQLVHDQLGVMDTITLVNHPITGPMFSGPQQQPFMCTTDATNFGIQPQVDSRHPPGFEVFAGGTETVIGYSRDCSIDPFITYFYFSETDATFKKLAKDFETLPDDVATTTTIDGDAVPFVVRLERGTINRFIYSYAMLVDPGEIPEPLDAQSAGRWNDRLLYRFQGGVGIGHSQGEWDKGAAMGDERVREALGLGYAVAYSTGTRTGVHYNLQVGGETALMTKERFVERFGQPLYTVGIGGSGGAIQQYVYGQNHPDLIDAAIPVKSYPDMVTQTIHIGDCELLTRYMDMTDVGGQTWVNEDNRSWLVGLNATFVDGEIENDLKPVMDVLEQQTEASFNTADGWTECRESWIGLTPFTLNPTFGSAPETDRWEPQSDIESIRWTHPDDLRNIYGLDEDGWAKLAIDNVGVQYGLRAFTRGDITARQFLDLNAEVGSWKRPKNMVEEGFPFEAGVQDLLNADDPVSLFDPWSRRNMRLSDGDRPAPRREADMEAIESLYEEGMVFQGRIDVPVLDIRPWLEPVLDMHNSHQSFAARQRIREKMGTAAHQVIWFADTRPDIFQGTNFNMAARALAVMDRWMLNILDRTDGEPTPSEIAANRPQGARDTCFTQEGEIIARGNNVWNGILDDRAEGRCARRFEIYAQSRVEAGGPITGDIFKCALKPVDRALTDGTYAGRSFTAAQKDRLREIFPKGVCDFSKEDVGKQPLKSRPIR